MRTLRNWLARPSLTRRLMTGQIALLSLLWTLVLGFLVWQSGTSLVMPAVDSYFDAVLAVAQHLEGQPTAQRNSLALLDTAMRQNYGAADEPWLRPTMTVQQRGRLIYSSSDAPPAALLPSPGNERRQSIGQVLWRARTKASSDGATQVTIAVPDDPWRLVVTLGSQGYYLEPLLISIPLLALPAWLSIRFALRPWRRVTRELAARGPGHLHAIVEPRACQELAGVVDNVNLMMERLRTSIAREKAFMADAAHELRTPLAALSVNVEALQALSTDPQGQQLLGAIGKSAQRAAHLVHQMLALTRSEAVPAQAWRQISLNDLVIDRLAILALVADTRGIELSFCPAIEANITAHEESLISLIDNLIENAIKYGPPGSRVLVELALRGQHPVLSVEDEGPGIPTHWAERVFDRFFRIPGQAQPGSGLGLSIAQTVAARHRASITLSCPPKGYGLLVEVTFPDSAGDGKSHTS